MADQNLKCGACGQLIKTDAIPDQRIPCPTCERTLVVPIRTGSADITQIAMPVEAHKLVQDERSSSVFVAPWVISAAIHVLVLFVMGWYVFTEAIEFDSKELVIPEIRLSTNPGGVMEPGFRTADRFTIRDLGDTRKQQIPEIKEWRTKAPSKTSADLAPIGVGSGGDVKTPGSSGMTGAGRFFGLQPGGGGNIKRICYVVDCSGSMSETFDFVIAELKSSIGTLKKDQYFHVIFFSENRPIELDPKTLTRASRSNKQAAYRFLDTIVAERGTEPGPALKRAFDVNNDKGEGAQLIYFLTDGGFDPKLLGQLAAWNRRRSVAINTISFVYRSDEQLLREIAALHGGQFKFVSRHDLGLQRR
jgi:hypothetical protein